MTRGDPVCRREDCSPFDIGLVFDEIHNYSPHQKLEFVENVWKPGFGVQCGRNANKLDKLRIAQRQMHRNNAPAATPEGYFKINLTRVFLDHVLQQLNTRFQDDVFVCYKGISIIPSVLLATDPAWKANVLEFCNHYRQDIPNYAGLQAELLLWERLWKGRDNRGDIIPDSLEATLKDIDKDAYVNIYSMLKVLITIPISSASCERSISSLRNLKNYLRNTMTQDRLNGLALMHAHRDMDFDLERIIDLFAELHPRRMRMANIL
ncbi:52 kDa repressor of the inhibitor of the protein kinase-like [Pocillopora verrucosa]|uniref:52 kDa repressor of the inhibitor of the protein kinase-like n=1 Tax=Pocillopora verrucosa TaxID=203993 RepID=UPI0033417466